MPAPYTFENLELITGGNAELDVELMNIFLATAYENLDGMRVSLHDAKSDEWRHNAHALKGSCLNIGARDLAELCRLAESQANVLDAFRVDILAKIEKEFAELEQEVLRFIDAKKQRVGK